MFYEVESSMYASSNLFIYEKNRFPKWNEYIFDANSLSFKFL